MDVSKFAYHHPTPWDAQFDLLTLPDLFQRTADRAPAAPFLHFMGRTYSYGEIYREARRFAAGLQARGIAKGDRVGLFLPNVPIYVSAYYGAMMAGAVVVNFSPLYSVEELAWQVGDSGTRLLVTVDVLELFDTAAKVLEGSDLETLVVGALADMLPFGKGLLLKTLGRSKIAKVGWSQATLKWRDCTPDSAPEPVALDAENDLALLQYTGGTTGRPKGAMLGHSQLVMNAQQVAAINPFGEADKEVFMGALPFFHVFANTALLNHAVASGGSIAMVPRFDAKQVLQTIQKYQATGFPGVPTMFQALLDHPDLAKTDLSSLKVCISGGAPMPAPVHARFEEVTGVRLVEGYGLTESSGVVSVNPYAGTRKRGTIGQVVARTEFLFLDKEDPTKLAPEGEPGELAIHGPQIMRGYWNRPEAAADAFIIHQGKSWLRTGDVAVVDGDGFLQIVDRIKDMIAVGGFKVFPSQVEDVILEHEAVKEALVIGVPDDYLGEVPRVFITLAGDVDIGGDSLKSWLNDRVGKHERVDKVVIRDELPKTIIGKLDRKALRAEVLG
ncbi:long-chain-fatty-acid--CoA ligase [Parerythrobacter jejuensis]|uniref:AMP-binding protein n=1 Tax=Parerythrobacter jejuensis TaxID=795812 RepID=A0A845AVW6_9SPHN|nr:long-chain fatty acid--CoA ligase [Parerythrobacter jejuensis]MXP30909.1 AMP-binding protein [Parerythrobacter jejuensis]MXP33669.1 AMP-binding protein [Parerythrobacter jejuensis]